MNFFDQLVIPPSPQHAALLNVIQVLAFVIFMPFTGMLAGGSLLSVCFNYLGKKKQNEFYIRFSKDLIEKLSISRNAGYALGMLPVVTILFVYAQFLYDAKLISVNLLLLSVIFFIASYVLIYNYKQSFQLEKIFNSFKSLIKPEGEKIPADVTDYENKIISSNSRYGSYGTVILYLAIFLFVGSITIASNTQDWTDIDNIFGLIVSGDIWINFLFFISFSFAITGGAILFFFFSWQGGVKDISDEYLNHIKKYAVNIAFISTLALPVFLFINIISLPKTNISASVYVYSGLTLLSILIVCNLLYATLKDSKIKFAVPVFIILLLTFTFNIAKDQISFGNAIKGHLQKVYAKSDAMEKELEASIVTSNSALDPQKIFDTKCSACHRFDVRLVGPPYQQTVPKYNGDVNKLAEFIYNPIKINPEYSTMPNQGLKKKEAEAMAQWLISKVGKK